MTAAPARARRPLARPRRGGSLRGIRIGLPAVVALLVAVPPVGGPTGGSSSAAAATRAPVVVIVMENHEFGQIVGSSLAPFINRTLIPQGRLFTNYTATFHPSLPNYLAMTTGSNEGCLSDGCWTSGGSAHAGDHVGNLFHQLLRAHIRFATYAESMTRSCDRVTAGDYAARHNPEVYFHNMTHGRCAATDLAMGHLDPSRLPAFSFVVPNVCDDMHTACSTNPITQGDTWLSAHVPALLKAGAIVIVTFDEGTTDTGGGGQVATIEAGPGIPTGTRNGTAYNHYGLLAGIERYFGLSRLHNAKTATPLPL